MVNAIAPSNYTDRHLSCTSLALIDLGMYENVYCFMFASNYNEIKMVCIVYPDKRVVSNDNTNQNCQLSLTSTHCNIIILSSNCKSLVHFLCRSVVTSNY